jgi:dihydrofolate reductase
MSKVYTGASMSLDGYIAGPQESGFDQLFKWYSNGDVPMPTANPEMTFRLTQQSHKWFTDYLAGTGSLVVGRKLFDLTNGWGGQHPLAVPTVVLTHSVPDGWDREGEHFTFVTEGGIVAAIDKAKQLAAGGNVGLNGGTIASQALEAGLLDEVWVDLVPVLLGDGVPFISGLKHLPVVLEGPIASAQGIDVTHLRYKVVRP